MTFDINEEIHQRISESLIQESDFKEAKPT